MSISYVGERAAGFTATVGTAVAVPVTVNAVAGNTLVLNYATRDIAADVTSVTDTKGNTWTLDKQFTDGTGKDFILVASTRQDIGALTSADTITVNHTTAATQNAAWLLEEFAGQLAADVSWAGGSAGANVTSLALGPTAATSVSEELVVAAVSVSIGTNTVTKDAAYSAFTTTYKGDGNVSGLSKVVAGCYKVTVSTGAQSATLTAGSSASFNGALVTYKAAASVPSDTAQNSGSAAPCITVIGASM